MKFKMVGILFFVLLICCARNDEEFEPELNVYCILKNNLPFQKIVVDRTYRMDEKAIYDLEDVQVILSGNGICDTLIKDSIYGELGLFRTIDSFPVVAGETYFLRVSAKGFDTLTGMTTIPDSFRLIYPDNGDTIHLLDTLVIEFEKSNQWIWITGYYQESLLVCNFWEKAEDTIYPLPVSSWASDTGFYKIMISIMDTNFVDYFYWHFDSIPRCGVQNGTGLFGGQFTKELIFYLSAER